MHSKSRGYAVTSIIGFPISILILIGIIVIPIVYLGAMYGGDKWSSVPGVIFILLLILFFGSIIYTIVYGIMSAVKTSNTTAKILTLIGMIGGIFIGVLFILGIVGLIMIIVHNHDITYKSYTQTTIIEENSNSNITNN